MDQRIGKMNKWNTDSGNSEIFPLDYECKGEFYVSNWKIYSIDGSFCKPHKDACGFFLFGDIKYEGRLYMNQRISSVLMKVDVENFIAEDAVTIYKLEGVDEAWKYHLETERIDIKQFNFDLGD